MFVYVIHVPVCCLYVYMYTCMYVCILNSSVYKMIPFMPVYFDNSEIQYLKKYWL